MDERKIAARELQVPTELDQMALEAKGIIHLEPNYAVFIRLEGCEDPKHDRIRAFAFDESGVAPDIGAAVERSWNEMLGDAESRSSQQPHRPTETDGDMNVLVGGAVFERALGHNEHNQQGERCYSFGIVVESGVGIAGPSINHKRIGTGTDEALERISRAGTVSCTPCFDWAWIVVNPPFTQGHFRPPYSHSSAGCSSIAPHSPKATNRVI